MRKNKKLTYTDRQLIEKSLQNSVPITAIADIIGCHKTTIYKEVAKNVEKDDEGIADYKQYSAFEAQCNSGVISYKAIRQDSKKG